MTRPPGLSFAAVALLVLGACAAPPAPAPVPAGSAARPAVTTDGDVRIGELPPQALADGQCGLFLWGRTVPARLVLFGDGQAAMVRLALDGRVVELTRTAAEGDPVFAQFPRQTFASSRSSGAEVALTLEFARRADLLGGAMVPRGLLELRDDTGWSVVMPVAGMIGCRQG